MKKKLNMNFVMIVLLSMVLSFGCNLSKTLKGGAIGAGAGAVVGGAIGHASGNTAKGAIIGAAIGGTAGALIGRYMDKQAEELRKDLDGATVERVGEGIKITFDSGLLYGVNSYTLRSDSKKNLEDLAVVLNKYEDTEILIEGHTDNTGSDETNQTLSVNRSSSVKSYLTSKNVDLTRLITVGYGESQPVADNSTAEGRQENRRVEVAIYANNKLKRAAKRGDI
ncbi:MAG: OmpA family protein [Bacteroidota bacterium]